MRKFLFVYIAMIVLSCNKTNYTIKEITPYSSFSILEISSAEQAVGYVRNFIVTDSLVVIADYQGNDIVYFTKNGSFIKRVGRSGQGPGEFKNILKIFQYSDYIVIDDFGNKRLQVLTIKGELVKLFHYAKHIITSGVKYQSSTFDRFGNYYLVTNAYQSENMIKKFDRDFDKLIEFGELESYELPDQNPYVQKALIQKRQLHSATKNNVLLVSSTDSLLYVIHRAIPLIKKYRTNGELIFKKELELDDLKQYRKEHFIEAEALVDRFVFKTFWYWHDAVTDNCGGLYLLFGDMEQMIVYHISESGNVFEKLLGPRARIMNIFYRDGILWAYTAENQTFYQFKLN